MALICHCRGVTERRIVKAIHRGATTPWEIEADCGAGGGCGGCGQAIEQLLDEHVAPITVAVAAGRHMLGAHAG
jgi:bacterioferritin-associated ferredoxin